MTRTASIRAFVVLAVLSVMLTALPGSAFAAGSGGANGSIDDPFAGTKDSFEVTSPDGATNFSGADSAAFSGASVSGDIAFDETLVGVSLEEVEASGSMTAAVGTTPLFAGGTSTYSVGFGGDTAVPMDFTLTGSLSVSSEDQPGDAAIAQVRLSDDSGDVVDIRIAAGNGSDSQGINESGTLPAGGFLEVFANLGLGSSPANTSANATFDIRFTLTPAVCVGPRADGRAAPAAQCTPTGHIVYSSPGVVSGTRLVVLSAAGTNPSQPLLLAGANQNLTNPTWEPNGQHILVVKNGEIFVMTAGGSDLEQLTNTPGENDVPDWSPDGTKIAFLSTRDGNAEVYVMNADGTNQRRLTNGGALDTTPRWSPGGQKIVFVSDRRGQNDIFTMNANGTGTPLRLTTDPASDIQPDFGPGGVILFATNRDGNAEVYSMRSDGQDQTNLTQSPGRQTSPRISPDGNFAAFLSGPTGNQDIAVMGITGGTPTFLTNTPGDNEHSIDWGQSACTRYGGNGDDTMSGSGHLCGGSGDDTLTGGATGDVLDGGSGDDTLDGKGGPDFLFGGDETPSGPGVTNDRLKGGEATDHIFGGEGNDSITGGGGADDIEGGGDKDDIEGDQATGNPQKDIVHGGPGNDTMAGGGGPDELFGEQGVDTIEGDDGEDTIFGGPDRDIVTACDGEEDTIFGGPGNRPGDAHDEGTFDRLLDIVQGVETRRRCA